ncbi:hypothetical protein [Candidatus Nitrosotalea okcheonensis]|uniref:Uncharacterized protein n=1 Tax=Candidatus Nitrosotalea okcheonensis TaxID=1903276 RepID=A0A2H1FEP9_9ARCH|nr:hypothetical protein [Candidatus Nitrosotalea okcheonensis]SMH71256.1 conserved exported protein of unknown function [Candidatus Nitrosotalea okcheonensis]
MKKIKEEKSNTKKRNGKIIVLLVMTGVIVGIVYAGYMSNNASPSAAPAVDGIECNTSEITTFHIHAHLDFYVNSNHLTVPERIGIVDNKCLYWLHTHDSSGVIHIESPKSQEFTLGQFMDIWKASGDFPIYGATAKIFVNGQLVNTSSNDTKINKHDEIALVYGNVPPAIPSFYQFDPGE